MDALELLKQTVPIREFTSAARDTILEHMLSEPPRVGGCRWACSISCALYEELEGKPELQVLVLELCWIVWRLDQAVNELKGKGQAALLEI